MRIAFEDRPVHERARIAFVGVADDVLGVAGRFAAQFPFHAGRETPAAAAAQTGFFDLANDFFGRPCGEGAGERAVTVTGDVLFDFFWIDDAAVGEHDPDLFAGERQVTKLRDVLNRLRLVGGRFAFGRAADGPFPNGPAVDDVFLDQTLHHVGLDVGIKHMRTAVELDVHKRFLGAHADAADARHGYREFPATEFLLDGLHRLARAGGNAAGASADKDGRASPGASGQRPLALFAQLRQVLDGIEFGHRVVLVSRVP